MYRVAARALGTICLMSRCVPSHWGGTKQKKKRRGYPLSGFNIAHSLDTLQTLKLFGTHGLRRSNR